MSEKEILDYRAKRISELQRELAKKSNYDLSGKWERLERIEYAAIHIYAGLQCSENYWEADKPEVAIEKATRLIDVLDAHRAKVEKTPA